MFVSAAYFLLTFVACSIGAVAGVGGGIIIKPLMDVFSGLPLSTINAMSGITVLTMTSVSLWKARTNAYGIQLQKVVYVAGGGVIGGMIGLRIFSALLTAIGNAAQVNVIQTVMLSVIVIVIMIGELKHGKLPQYHYEHPAILIGLGTVLGMLAVFLGIGGGPFNRPILLMLLGLNSKNAAYFSLAIIFFSQLSSVITLGVTTQFAPVDWSILPFMMLGAVIGGVVGAKVAVNLKDAYFDRFFFGVLVLMMLLNVFNLVRLTTGA